MNARRGNPRCIDEHYEDGKTIPNENNPHESIPENINVLVSLSFFSLAGTRTYVRVTVREICERNISDHGEAESKDSISYCEDYPRQTLNDQISIQFQDMEDLERRYL